MELKFTGEGTSAEYLTPFGGSVPAWEVEYFIAPGGLSQAQGKQHGHTSPKIAHQHDLLMDSARDALNRGEPRRAYSLAEEAYVICQRLQTLLFLTELRMVELNEPQARARMLSIARSHYSFRRCGGAVCSRSTPFYAAHASADRGGDRVRHAVATTSRGDRSRPSPSEEEELASTRASTALSECRDALATQTLQPTHQRHARDLRVACRRSQWHSFTRCHPLATLPHTSHLSIT